MIKKQTNRPTPTHTHTHATTSDIHNESHSIIFLFTKAKRYLFFPSRLLQRNEKLPSLSSSSSFLSLFLLSSFAPTNSSILLLCPHPPLPSLLNTLPSFSPPTSYSYFLSFLSSLHTLSPSSCPSSSSSTLLFSH